MGRRPWSARLAFLGAAALVAPLVVVTISATPAAALSLPSGFSLVTIPTGLTNELTNMVFLPDGTDTMIVLGKCGQMRRVTQTGTSAAVSFTPRNTVNCENDRGLVGIDLARDFATSRVAFISYNYKDSAGKYWGRLSRITFDSATAPAAVTAETVILDQVPSFSSTGATCDNSHTVGTVLVAPDGTLYVGDGDSSSYCNVDNSALAAQDLTSPRGKILHINADGSGVAANPFYDAADRSSWKSRVFAYGFRNPFRFTLKPGTASTLYIGDVGWNTYEEVDIAKGGEDFGWPCWEGPASFRNGYDALSQCQALYANPPAKLTAPIYYWNHFNSSGDAAIGGVLYQGSTYPADYQGAYFFGDYAAGRLWTLRTDGNDAVVRAPEANGFANAVGAPVAMRSGPNGDVFFADIGSANVQRVRYAAGNRAPTAVPTADRLGGSPPLTVNFDGSGSFDLDDEPITYAWNFGDGATSTAAKPSHQYTTAGVFTATLTVKDQLGATGAATLTINTRNNPPVLTVTGPPAGTTFAVGAPVSITASATDAEDGTIPLSGLTYQLIQHHCPTPGNCHLHPGAATTPTAPGPFTTTMPDHGDDSYLEIVVSARDSAGATATKSVVAQTEEHNLSVSSTPAGASVVVNATNSVANPVLEEVAGSQNRLIAPATAGSLVFLQWADGVTTPDRTITMPHADLALVAQYDTRPTAVATATPASGAAPLAVQFAGTASSDPDAGDAIVSYAWNFGDGATATGSTAAHTYAANGSYTATLTVTDRRGATGSATAAVTVGNVGTPIPAPSATAWQLNGTASMAGSALVLTPNAANAAGTAFYPTPVSPTNLAVSFDITIDQGSGADGATMILANPAAGAAPTSVGGSSGALGAAAIPGVAVVFDTFKGTGDVSANYVGVATTGNGLTYAQTSTAIGALRNATHHVDVTVTPNRVAVAIDRTPTLDAAVTVPASPLVGFTASTGGLTDRHMITNFSGVVGGTTPPPPPPPPPPTGQLSVAPASLAFGSVAVAGSAVRTFTVANTGSAALSVSSVSGPAVPFSMSGAPAVGSSLAAGQSVTVSVTLAPTVAGTWSSSVVFGSSAGSAQVALSGSTPAPGGGSSIPTPWAGGWQINGRAALSGSSLVLTPNVATVAGSAFYATAVPSNGLAVSFDATIDQGNGADGMALVLADASTSAPTALGAVGAGLGVAGIPGVAVALDTFQSAGDPSANFVGIVGGANGGTVTYLATSTAVPPLRNSTHHVDVAVSGGRVVVKVDGAQKLDVAVATLPPNVFVGFSAATGGLTDRHTVTNVVATTGGTVPPPPPAGQLSVAPASLAFGSVAVGGSSVRTFTVANTGSAALSVSSVSGPAVPFSVSGAPAVGSSLAAGQSVTVSVTLAPTVAGTWSSSVVFGSSAGSAQVALSGSTPAPGGGSSIPTPWAGGWQVNGRAALSGSSLVLTPNTTNVAGTAFYATAVPSAGLHVAFDITIDQGNGADGATMILANPTAGATPASVGGSGGALGAGGIPGVAVVFDTFKGTGDVSANYVGVATTGNGFTYAQTSTAIGALRNATHHVDVTVTANHVTVLVDGAPTLDTNVTVAPNAYLGFTASTGGLTDRHTITNVVATRT